MYNWMLSVGVIKLCKEDIPCAEKWSERVCILISQERMVGLQGDEIDHGKKGFDQKMKITRNDTCDKALVVQ